MSRLPALLANANARRVEAHAWSANADPRCDDAREVVADSPFAIPRLSRVAVAIGALSGGDAAGLDAHRVLDCVGPDTLAHRARLGARTFVEPQEVRPTMHSLCVRDGWHERNRDGKECSQQKPA